MEKQKKVPVIGLNKVKSSQIDKMGYCPDTKTLAVVFKHGKGEYRYPGVPPELHAEMLQAESLGAFFSANVKKNFKHVLITPEQKA